MPLDDAGWVEVAVPMRTVAPDLAEAIRLLKRAEQRVSRRYCGLSFYTAPSWWNWAPGFCMSGALTHSDKGKWECDRFSAGRVLAEKFVKAEIGGRSLVSFGTRDFVRGRVLRAFRRAIKTAEAAITAS